MLPVAARERQFMSTSRRIQILVGLPLALVVSLAFAVPQFDLTAHAQELFGTLVGRELPWWILVAVMLIYILAIERRPLTAIGLKRPGWMSFVWGLAGGLALLIGEGIIFAVVFPRLGLHVNQKAALGIIQTPIIYRAALVLRAAGAEEILFRGYGIERLDELTGNRILAAAITWAVFTYAHLGYWGWAQLIVAGYGGLVLTIMYLWRRGLASNMLAHLIGDAIPFL
jgi:membrane protease YdiL (CAAX protease family)